MLTPTTPLVRPLDNPRSKGLTLKSVATADDVERLAAFNAHIHDEVLRPMTRSLILQHPHTRPEHWLYIEDDASKAVVADLCLIPWVWRYEDVELKSGEVGIVGTLEDYRNRGLSRALMMRHHELLAEGEYDMSHIQGIPYFYRQFGYEYALPLEGGWRVDLYNIPKEPEGGLGLLVRKAGPDDLPMLMQFHREAACELNISAQRDVETWRYLLNPDVFQDGGGEFWLISDLDGQAVGYVRTYSFGFGEGLIVSEVSRLSQAVARGALIWLKSLATQRNKPYIRLNIPAKSSLVQTARRMDAKDQGTYSWQIHLPNVPRLLRKIAPVLERRIAASAFAGLTETLRLNLYREAFDLRFEAGKLAEVNSVGFQDGGEVRIPPLLLAPLLLGWRSREELAKVYPDVSVWGPSQYLVDVLFPKMDAFIYTIY